MMPKTYGSPHEPLSQLYLFGINMLVIELDRTWEKVSLQPRGHVNFISHFNSDTKEL